MLQLIYFRHGSSLPLSQSHKKNSSFICVRFSSNVMKKRTKSSSSNCIMLRDKWSKTRQMIKIQLLHGCVRSDANQCTAENVENSPMQTNFSTVNHRLRSLSFSPLHLCIAVRPSGFHHTLCAQRTC